MFIPREPLNKFNSPLCIPSGAKAVPFQNSDSTTISISQRPYGARDSFWPLSQDSASLVLGYSLAALPGRENHFGLFPRTALRLSWAILLPPLRGARIILASFPGLRFACPGLFSCRPSGARESFWPLSQDCASLVLGYSLAAPKGREIHFGLFPRTALRLSWAILLPPLRGARIILAFFPGLRFACPGLFSCRPSGADADQTVISFVSRLRVERIEVARRTYTVRVQLTRSPVAILSMN